MKVQLYAAVSGPLMVKIPLEIVVDSLFTQFQQDGTRELPEAMLVSIPVTRRADGKIAVQPSRVDSACPVEPQEWAREEMVFCQPPSPKLLCWDEVVCCSERIAAAVAPVKVRQCATRSETLSVEYKSTWNLIRP